MKNWLTCCAPIHPKGVLFGLDQDYVLTSQVLPYQTCSSMSLWTLACTLVQRHVGKGGPIPKLFPQSWKHEIFQNVSVCKSIKSFFQFVILLLTVDNIHLWP
ncbi:hypothetical protein ATANTOWER_023960 [Ataeniobius toweri]|uniref:Uncharacterized protein n=1 Tax=Ataeniobius toweri TaxID=208326 RepID=A0ABU7BAX3_9TELE|nr:hypothetical protein [Ataeniobius toweri]